MSIQYGNYSKKELQRIVDVTPPEMPHYQRARDEMTLRIAMRGPDLTRISLIIAGLVALTTVIVNFEKIADFARYLFK